MTTGRKVLSPDDIGHIPGKTDTIFGSAGQLACKLHSSGSVPWQAYPGKLSFSRPVGIGNLALDGTPRTDVALKLMDSPSWK